MHQLIKNIALLSLAVSFALPTWGAPFKSVDAPIPTAAEKALHDRIGHTMPLTVRVSETDSEGNFALPKPYSVPCVEGGFHNMFYWDTYFTNAGLLLEGDIWQSRNNIENIAAMISKYGYMPNATAKSMLNRSQPPLFSMMVKDYYDATGDKDFLKSMVPVLAKEYDFWMTKRIAPNGLNRYGHNATDKELIDFCNAVAGRVHKDVSGYNDEQRKNLGAHLLAEAESGADFTPRYSSQCMDYNPVDLNAILYGFEKNQAFFLHELGLDGSKEWDKKADKRKKLMRKLMRNPKDGLYYDYNFADGTLSPVYSSAPLALLWQGVVDKSDAKAIVNSLDKIETPYGVLTCAPGDRNGANYQWDAPNGWAPVQFYTIKGLDRYGYKDEATRVARKYLDSMNRIYAQTGQLWEKFNAEKGNNEVAAEYPMDAEFMGWTAGAYETAYNYLYGSDARQDAPRVVNVINFIRATEPRRYEHPSLNWISDTVLYETVESQIDILNKYGIKGTFLIQYDAMIRPEYPELLKNKPIEGTEIGGWWEITEPHCKDAGIEWRGRYPWDWFANVGFSTGYTPAEREKLVDVYMAKYKEIFGEYPKSVGSWFIDSHSLGYMHDKYGVETSTSCRDQLGTDGYNLWGGYWQGGYYPSKNNFFIPAQTKDQQIDVPTFRMLGSDPIAQYDCGLGGKHQAVVTLEPVYGNCGGNKEWINWFFDKMIYDPAMNLSYFQAGQENMFTWPRMRYGLEYQFPLLARLAQKGDIRLETLAQTGEAFRKAHDMTPPSSISAMNGFFKPEAGTVWFNSKDYRMNLMWEGARLFVRDIHLFDQNQKSLYLTERCTTPNCFYYTLPIVEGNVWSNDSIRGCLAFYEVLADGSSRMMQFGEPVISNDGKVLTVKVPIIDSAAEMIIRMDETEATFSVKPLDGMDTSHWQAPRWFAALEHAPEAQLPFAKIDADRLEARYRDYNYAIAVKDARAAAITAGPRNHEGALRAFTITPDKNSFTLNFAK